MSQVAVLAPQSLARAGLVSLLTSWGFRVVAEAASLEELTDCDIGDAGPDLVLTTLVSSAADVCPIMRAIKAWAPTTKVVFLTPDLDFELLSECFVYDAGGYLLEHLSADALQKSLALVGTGEKVFPSALASLLADTTRRKIAPFLSDIQGHDISARELEILGLLAVGRSNKEIATRLNIAESTAKLHLRNILRKLSASNRTQAALWAAQRGIAAE